MSERHQFGNPIDNEASPDLPDPFWADKDPAEWVGREYVGERQRTHTIHGQGATMEYRVGLNSLDEPVVDRIALDPFFRAPEPTRIELAEAPEQVREEANELLAEYVPEAREH
ncbi:MAG: hypothetical protein Q8Q11_03340 [bacterium]|nr:hypothetical protein [bacterium]MDZ4247981.1 hypothetical protein [Patescibacteria group bacterium]